MDNNFNLPPPEKMPMNFNSAVKTNNYLSVSR